MQTPTHTGGDYFGHCTTLQEVLSQRALYLDCRRKQSYRWPAHVILEMNRDYASALSAFGGK